MRTISFFILILLLWFQSFTQQTVKAVEADQEINQVFTVKDLYRYPQYIQGKVFFRDGTIAEAMLNYHKLFEQVLFIDQKGDSLAVGNPETISVIVMGQDSFYYNKDSYYELIESYKKSIQLARKQMLQEMDQQKTGAYGQSYTNNSTVANKNYYTVDGKPRLNVGESTLFLQKTEYYISYKHGDFLPANKKNIEKLFSEYSRQVKDYIKENSLDIAKEEGLKKLLQFIQDL
ncbi:MAG TPA: hypothetical protein VGQ09_05300 [Chitinophagaceae bacterium]|jgi:hypothetical protein|nr:hypothetical protein [Chitinophagaceae bacterium]